MAKSVCVFMSSYNGEKYIKEQIESILNQQLVDVHVFVRDDGSTDSTRNVVKEISKNDDRVSLVLGNNIGFEHSFMELCVTKDEYDYYAFSDQDDFWEQNRLHTAINKIGNKCSPCLYGSNFYIADKDLKIVGKWMNINQSKKLDARMKKYGAIGDNLFACTMVWNKAFQKVLMSHRPTCKISHDVWTQMVLDYVGGELIYDDTPTMLHRIHNSNTAGIARGFLKKIKKGVKIYINSGISPKAIVANEINSAFFSRKHIESNKTMHRVFNLVMEYPHSFRKKMQLIFSRCFLGKPFGRWCFNSYLVLINKY